MENIARLKSFALRSFADDVNRLLWPLRILPKPQTRTTYILPSKDLMPFVPQNKYYSNNKINVEILTHFDIRDRRDIAFQSSKHCHKSEHTGHQKNNPTRNSIQSQPKTEPRKHDDQSRGCERLYQMMTDLSLKA